jgi:hypothetical protein
VLSAGWAIRKGSQEGQASGADIKGSMMVSMKGRLEGREGAEGFLILIGYIMDKLKLTGRNLGRVCNSKLGHAFV